MLPGDDTVDVCDISSKSDEIKWQKVKLLVEINHLPPYVLLYGYWPTIDLLL